MATLTGKLADVTSKTPENISSITVKAPSARIGSGTDVIVSSPAKVTFNKTTGAITISGLTGGLSWLHIEGDGWTDSIALAVAEGMVTVVEAVANAAGTPGLADYIALLVNLQSRIDDMAQGSIDSALGTKADKTYVDSELGTKADKTYVDSELGTKADKTYVDAEKWYRPALGLGDTLDDKRGASSVGIYPVTSAVDGLPYPDVGWVTVIYNATSQSTRQIYRGASYVVTSTWERVYWGGEWREWVRNPSGDALSREIQEGSWLYQERLTSANNIDLLVNEDDQHMYMCSSAVVGLPAQTAGWLTVYHERASKRAMQVYMSSSPDVAGYWTRKYDGSVWGAWERFDPRSSSGGGNARDTLVTLGHAATPWETAKLVASYEQGELYLDQVATQVPFVSKETIGHSSGGNPISGLLLGDEGKPIVYIDCATHGDEVSSREAMLIWLKMVASRRARWMDHVAAFVVPTLNVDRINVHRRTINNIDMNRDYVDQSTAEVQSNVATVQAKDPIFYACCHEYRTDNRGDIGILMQPTNQSWLPDKTVKSVSGRIYNEIRERLTSEGIDSGPYPQSFTSTTPPVQAHYYMSSVLNIPSMLIEAPGILESNSNSGNYPSPRRYVPNLEKRIHDYMLVLDQVMESAAVIAQERAEN